MFTALKTPIKPKANLNEKRRAAPEYSILINTIMLMGLTRRPHCLLSPLQPQSQKGAAPGPALCLCLYFVLENIYGMVGQ